MNQPHFDETPAPVLRDFYRTLDIPKHATQMMIRESYVRMKAAYAQNNPALYSLFPDSQRQESLQEVERAYSVLMDPEKREDHNQQLMQRKMASLHDFQLSHVEEPAYKGFEPILPKPISTHTTQIRKRTGLFHKDPALQSQYATLIEHGNLGDGALYLALRTAAKLTLGEIQQHTNIATEHLQHIEENAFDRLLHPAYTKGFLRSYFEFLGVQDPLPLICAFMENYENWLKKNRP